MISLRLPMPPSVNAYWRHPSKGPLAGRTLVSEEGRAYRNRVAWEIKAMRLPVQLGRLSVAVRVCAADRRRRDLDNVLKALLDALVHGGLFPDDSAIDRLLVERGPLAEHAHVLVSVSVLPDLVTEVTPQSEGLHA